MACGSKGPESRVMPHSTGNPPPSIPQYSNLRGRRPSNHSRDNSICPILRRSSLEGRRPRRLVRPLDIKRFATFVPAAGGAAGPPIVPAIIRFVRSCHDRPWRAGGLAGLLEPSISNASQHLYLRPAGPPALQSFPRRRMLQLIAFFQSTEDLAVVRIRPLRGCGLFG
jgi:hypothetical protein